MLQPVLLSLHLIAVMAWIGGQLALLLVLAAGSDRDLGTSQGAALAAPVLRWDRRVTQPAMLAVWALGLTLAIRGGWFPAPWLIGKLAMVAALSALHGLLAGRLRRRTMAEAPAVGVTALARTAGLVFALLLPGIVVLAVIKPG